MKYNPELVAMIAGNLMAGAHPDQSGQINSVPGFVRTAIAIVAESEKQCAAQPEPATGGGLRNPNNPSPPEGPVSGHVPVVTT